MNRAYSPFVPARSPGGRPEQEPQYRILVHRKFEQQWDQLVQRVGIAGARQFWNHVSRTPSAPSAIASITLLKGAAGKPMNEGWSRTHHYEVSGAGRINYQYNNHYMTTQHSDEHAIVAIMTINYSSH